jgi:hypothetical protein
MWIWCVRTHHWQMKLVLLAHFNIFHIGIWFVELTGRANVMLVLPRDKPIWLNRILTIISSMAQNLLFNSWKCVILKKYWAFFCVDDHGTSTFDQVGTVTCVFCFNASSATAWAWGWLKLLNDIPKFSGCAVLIGWLPHSGFVIKSSSFRLGSVVFFCK